MRLGSQNDHSSYSTQKIQGDQETPEQWSKIYDKQLELTIFWEKE